MDVLDPEDPSLFEREGEQTTPLDEKAQWMPKRQEQGQLCGQDDGDGGPRRGHEQEEDHDQHEQDDADALSDDDHGPALVADDDPPPLLPRKREQIDEGPTDVFGISRAGHPKAVLQRPSPEAPGGPDMSESTRGELVTLGDWVEQLWLPVVHTQLKASTFETCTS